jgi:hypothetical protein
LFAEPLARLVQLAPPVSGLPTLEPPLAWTAWRHTEPGLWPRPDDHDVDLNAVPGPPWLDRAARVVRERLAVGGDQVVVGHGDWYAGNLRWAGDMLLVAHDWDSMIADSEAAIAGFAAAVFPTQEAGDEATVEETEAFLAVYAEARGVPFSADETERAWAAGLWLRAFDAKKQLVVGQPMRSLTEAEATIRLQHVGRS